MSDYWTNTNVTDITTAIPVRRTTQFLEKRPFKRIVWRFIFEDGAIVTTYDNRLAMDLTDRMMKAGRING